MSEVRLDGLMTGLWWTWREDNVVHGTIGDQGKYQATMRQVVCRGSYVDLVFIKSSREQPVNCLLCLGAWRVEP